MMRNGMWKAVVIALTLALALTSALVYADRPNSGNCGEVHCHGDEEETTGPAATNDINLTNSNKFDPDDVLANGSLAITWFNVTKNKTHTVHILDATGANEVWPNQVVAAGESFELPEFSLTAGTKFLVVCEIHNNMDMILTTQ